MKNSTFPFHVVVYWDDIENDARRALVRGDILKSGADTVCFYAIREHEIRYRLEEAERKRRIETMAGFAKELESNGVETAAALLPSLGWGQVKEEGPFQKITGPDGTRSGSGCCPLDEDLRAHLKEYIRVLAGHGFKTLQLEDDFQNNNHRPVREGCFCPLHLAAFSKREKREFTRETLVEALQKDPDLKRRWQQFKSDILVDLAKELQGEAKRIEPSTRLVLLGGSDLRDLVERVDWKEWRPPQGSYEEHRFTPVLAPMFGHLQRMVVPAERRPPCLAEITSWPRNAFAKSWETFGLQAALNAFLGFDAALFWAGIGFRDRGFADFAGRNRSRLDFVRAVASDHPRMVGLHVPILPHQPRLTQGMISLARMGVALNWIPMHAVDSRSTVALLESSSLPKEFFSPGQPAILDLGTLRDGSDVFATDYALRPSETMFSAERIADDPLNGTSAGLYSTSLTLLKPDDMQLLHSTRPLRVLSHYVDGRSQTITPCVAIDEERRWLLINNSPATWERLISAFKTTQMQNAIEHINDGPLPVTIVGGTDTFVFARESDTHRVVFVMNLSMDALPSWQIRMDREVSSSSVADERGAWKSLSVAECPVQCALRDLPPRSAMLFRFALK